MDENFNKKIDQHLESMTNMAIPFHLHNGWDSSQLDPAVALLGFPVVQVADASVAPTDVPINGIFRFQVDATPDYYLWAYMVYTTSLGVLTGAWKTVALSTSGSSSPLTTKGDIFTYSTANDRLGVGTNGQILTPNTGATTGLAWSVPCTSVLATRDMSTASGAVTYAHGLGRVPIFVEITGYVVAGSGLTLSSYGTYDGANSNVIFFSKNGANPQANNNTGFVIGLVPVGGTDAQTATITVDATNVTLTWSKLGTPTGTASIIIKSS